MAPSTQQVAVAALAAAGCTAFVATPSTVRGPALRSAAQGQAKASSSSSMGAGLAICGLGAAAAVAAPRKEKAALSLRALTPAQELIAGTGGPMPDMFWDPAGISARATEEEILKYRAIELKHGRVAMLAVLHWFHVAAGYHLLGDYAIGERMSDDPLVSLTQLPMGGMWQVIFTIMCLEWLTTYICKPPADRPWDVLGWKGIIVEDYPSEIWNGWKRVQCQELNNSRLAMVAITGLIAQDVVTGDYVAGVGKLCGGLDVCQVPAVQPEMWEFPPLDDAVLNAPAWKLLPDIP
ncbi:FCPB [Symbiodinium pilosum]|uniref:FCPB protein n=1 Tax=Symbiodinium pilosum TaxID=2952 RepID=A0A812WVZ4_SYMPI|nr:FCPB [Symbiodinium pilosum]